MFITLIIRCGIYTGLRHIRLSNLRKNHQLCVPKALMLFNMITIDCILHEGRYSCLRKLSRAQSIVLSCFGLNKEEMRRRCKLLGDKYLIAQQIKESNLDQLIHNEQPLPANDQIDHLAGVTDLKQVN